MKRDWSLVPAHRQGEGNGPHILRSLLEERYRDLPSLAFNRLLIGQGFFCDSTFSKLRPQFTEERVFCTLLYLNRFLLDLPLTDSVPLHRLERALYEPRLQAFRPEEAPLELVQETVQSY